MLCYVQLFSFYFVVFALSWVLTCTKHVEPVGFWSRISTNFAEKHLDLMNYFLQWNFEVFCDLILLLLISLLLSWRQIKFLIGLMINSLTPLCLFTSRSQLLRRDKIKAEQNSVAANDNNEFKKIQLIKIQIFRKVKRYRFVLKCYQDRHKISKKSDSLVDLYVRNTSFLKWST